MYNHAQWLRNKMEDPKTSRSDYMKYWYEYQDLVRHQKQLDEEAIQRFRKSQLERKVA